MPLTDDENAKLQALAAARAKADAANAAKGIQPNNIQITPDSSPWEPTQTPQRTAPPYPISPEQAQARGYDPTGQRLAAAQAAPPAAAQAGGIASDLKGRWNDFIGRPENRAGMMQFAVNMLAGKGLGESIGSAAEATGRNVTAQEEEQKYEEQQALKEREQAVKESEAESYGIASRRKPIDPYERMAMTQQNALDRENRSAWDSWMKDPLARAGILDAVQKKFPNIKSKDDLDKPGNEAARDLAQQALLGGRLGGGGAGAAAPRVAAPRAVPPKPANVPNAQLMNVNGEPVWYDPKTKLPAQ